MAYRWRTRYTLGLILAFSFFIFLVAALADRIFHRVGTGEVGVLYLYFWGTETKRTYPEGITITFPWNEIFLYDVREQQYSDEVVVLSYNGLSIKVTFSFRFQLVAEKVGVLHVVLGPDYLEKVIKPTLFASVREVVGNYRPEELFTTHSATLQDEIRVVAQQSIENYHIRFNEILVKSIVLPPKVENAIQDKLVLQQIAEGYDFRLVSEERERQRKQIESDGIRIFHETVAKGLGTKSLTYLQIRAIENLAASQNAKILLLGSGKHDSLMLPIMVDGLDTTPSESSKGINSEGVTDQAVAEANQNAAGAPQQPTSEAGVPLAPSVSGPAQAGAPTGSAREKGSQSSAAQPAQGGASQPPVPGAPGQTTGERAQPQAAPERSTAPGPTSSDPKAAGMQRSGSGAVDRARSTGRPSP